MQKRGTKSELCTKLNRLLCRIIGFVNVYKKKTSPVLSVMDYLKVSDVRSVTRIYATRPHEALSFLVGGL